MTLDNLITIFVVPLLRSEHDVSAMITDSKRSFLALRMISNNIATLLPDAYAEAEHIRDPSLPLRSTRPAPLPPTHTVSTPFNAGPSAGAGSIHPRGGGASLQPPPHQPMRASFPPRGGGRGQGRGQG
eukprot:CAMPEP_0177684206 /NCGR_PEP_ID=MMETSP0447-20121125/32287_1 /TAXON_ID=0 /ORGANISM="Stygamoeba regulata, Strain BSH-02190019" /LENGTH=127 /DNA_ID=CAMNT_0019193997 /DNA_START=137 /DNA_END=517 /DNA_ORIENTATION=+